MKRTPHIRILLLALAAAFLPHVLWLPPWITGFCLCLWTWRFLLDVRGRGTPSRVVRLLLTGTGLACVLLLWGPALGRTAGTGLLCLMLAVKPMETETHRDRTLLLLLALFLLFSSALFSQNLLLGVYMLPALGFILSALLRIHHPEISFPAALRRSGAALLQAAPLGLVLFLLFPRLPGGFFSLDKSSSAAGVSGISERMAPGSISRVARSDEVAFRADFRGPIPPAESLYWRATVLTLYNGREWRPGPRTGGFSPAFRSASSKRAYTVILEPSGTRLLPALDLPTAAPDRARLERGYVLKARERVSDSIRYRLASVLDYATASPEPGNLRRCLQLAGRNPKTRRLVRTMLERSDGPRALMREIASHFRDNGFAYTLDPEPLQPRSSIDAFLFRTRSGFCAHYAQAAAWMLRAGGVPARIVAGYHGGETNPVGDYLIVRRSHAHAWVEAYLRGKGWVRFDPTTAVSGSDAGEARNGGAAARDSSWLGLDAPDWLEEAWHGVRLGWDAASHAWTMWVLGYDYSDQSTLLQSLRLGKDVFRALSRVILLATAMVFLLLGAYAAVLLKRGRAETDRARTLYDRFRRRLARAGLRPLETEGPADLADRVSRQRPDLGDRAREVVDLYIRLRYRGQIDRRLHRRLRRAVSRFRPRQGRRE